MAKRDPNKTARNKAIQTMQDELRQLLPNALRESHRQDEPSLNAFIGSKADEFLNLKNDVIRSPEEYISKWLLGLTKKLKEGQQGAVLTLHDYLKDPSKRNFKRYCEIFLRRSFLKHYDKLSKVRPEDEHAFYWFGLNNAYHGLFITPRFNKSINDWENDKSEIRAFTKTYWTIEHILETGLCYPNQFKTYNFSKIDDYLNFFHSQVRLTQSPYQLGIADRYITFVKESKTPEKIPLLIPEMRYNHPGKHQHRLDFFVINPYTMDKIGFELSPWSTHGKLSGKHKTLIELNEEAKENFEKEIKKIKSYFSKYNIYTIVYTDSDLQNLDTVFKDISRFLLPTTPPEQLSLNLIDAYFGM